MKKSQLTLAAVPIVCALGGFGAGTFLKGADHGTDMTHAADTAHEAKPHVPAPRTEAEAALHALATEDGHGKDHGPDHQSDHQTEHDIAKPMDHPDTGKPDSHGPETLTKVSMNDAATHKAPPVGDVPEVHRIDYDKLAKAEAEMKKKAAIAKARARQEQRMADMKKAPRAARGAHPSLLPLETEAKIHEEAIKRIVDSDDHVVKMGRLTVPVYGARSTAYYVADFAITVTDLDQAGFYFTAENATRVRDQVMTTMATIAETQLLRGPRVESEVVAERIAKDLRDRFFGVEDFLFLSLYKTDVPRG